ncbi:MAG: peptidoglycan-binding domain-containing protein [Candidatus Parcubacteria bacterium]|nr:peptidoglycan-binding domain-containing protein [Candidatus Parcubacteria bacterium]
MFASSAFALTPDDFGVTSSYCPTLTITIQYGARDASYLGQVTELQKFLAGYYHYDPNELVTGYFGRTTKRYVQQFQKEQGFPVGAQLGIAGSMTRASIANVCGQTPSVQTNVEVTPTVDTNATPSTPTIGSSLEQQVADLLNLVTSLQGQLNAQQTVIPLETTAIPVETTIIPTDSQSVPSDIVPAPVVITPALVIPPVQNPVVVPPVTTPTTEKTNASTPPKKTSTISTVPKSIISTK